MPVLHQHISQRHWRILQRQKCVKIASRSIHQNFPLLSNSQPPLISHLFFSSSNTWSLFVLITCFHLYANWRAVRAVTLHSLNQERFSILVRQWLSVNADTLSSISSGHYLQGDQTGQKDQTGHKDQKGQGDPKQSIMSSLAQWVPDVKLVNRLERVVLATRGYPLFSTQVCAGASFDRLGKSGGRVLREMEDIFAGEPYMLWWERGQWGRSDRVLVFYETGVSNATLLKSMLHVELILLLSSRQNISLLDKLARCVPLGEFFCLPLAHNAQSAHDSSPTEVEGLLRRSKWVTDALCPHLMTALWSSSWDADRLLFELDEYRYARVSDEAD